MQKLSDDDVSAFALSLPQTFMTEQWMGAHVFKVGHEADFKMFAILRPGHQRVTVKLPSEDIAALLIEAQVASCHSHLPRGGWVELHTDAMDADDVKERIRQSYETVRPSLKRKTRDALGL